MTRANPTPDLPRAVVTTKSITGTDSQTAGIRQLVQHPAFSTLAAGIAIAWVSWPLGSLEPSTGLDSSWQAALNMAAHQSLDFGEDVIFTYGPLGFLATPFLYYPPYAGLAGLYVGVLHVATVASLLWAARRVFGFVPAIIATWAIAKTVILLFPTTLFVPAVAFIWCVEAIRHGGSGWTLRLIAIAGGALGAFELLVRFNIGVVVLTLCGLTVLMEPANRARNIALFSTNAVASFLFFWILTNQDFGALPEYFRYSYELAAGYSNAMGFEEPGRQWEYVAAVVVGGLVVFTGWRSTDSWPSRRRVKLLVLGAVLGYATFKQAFVRHDVGHAAVWFTTGAAAVLALAWRRRYRIEVGLALAAVLLTILGSARFSWAQMDPFRSAGRAADHLQTVLSSDRLEVARDARVDMRDSYALDEATLRAIRGRTVHIAPVEAAIAWAYPELKWKPLPVIQSYSAYTRRLDRLNAELLESDEAPEFILRYPGSTIDGRHPSLEAPLSILAMYCRYAHVLAGPQWHVLQHSPNRCGSMRRIASAEVRRGERFAVPRGSGSGLILADLREYDSSPWERVRATLFRRSDQFIRVNDTTTIRMVPDTLTDLVIVHIPTNLDYPDPFSLSVDAATLCLDAHCDDSSGDSVSVPFYELSVTAGG
jgi:hypothetical protein